MDKSFVDRARQNFADRNPTSRRMYDDARLHLPGGHTRTVLTHRPFPLTFLGGRGAVLTDADGHEYIDLLGDYTAGLLGHSEKRVIDSVSGALHTNMSVGGIHPAESTLAALMCRRFGLARVRFTNSGTEANLMAITTARFATKRSKVMVFDGGYHGGILYFGSGIAEWTAPYPFVLAPFNDLTATKQLITDHADDLAAVLIEPMQGSGGCLPVDTEFLLGVFAAAREIGAVCIADEVMTSRHGRSGMVRLLGGTADITAFGKYVGGGFSFGAFGGSAELLDLFDTSPEAGRTDVIGHAGTFNNNIATMTAGCTVLGEIFTDDVAEEHTARGNDFRSALAAVLGRHNRLPLSVTGFGSLMNIHTVANPPTTAGEAARRDEALHELIFLGLLERGVYMATRGLIALSLVVTDDQLSTALERLDDCLADISETAGRT